MGRTELQISDEVRERLEGVLAEIGEGFLQLRDSKQQEQLGELLKFVKKSIRDVKHPERARTP